MPPDPGSLKAGTKPAVVKEILLPFQREERKNIPASSTPGLQGLS